MSIPVNIYSLLNRLKIKELFLLCAIKTTFIVALVIVLTTNISYSAHPQIAIVANTSFNTEKISQNKIQKLWLGKTKKLPNIGRVYIIDQKPNNSITKLFYKRIIKKKPNQIKAYWAKFQYIGKGFPPRTVESDSDVIQWLLDNKNGIGYIDRNSVTDDLKVLMIISGQH